MYTITVVLIHNLCVFVQTRHGLPLLFQKKQMCCLLLLSQRGGAGPPVLPIPAMEQDHTGSSTLTISDVPPLPQVKQLFLIQYMLYTQTYVYCFSGFCFVFAVDRKPDSQNGFVAIVGLNILYTLHFRF